MSVYKNLLIKLSAFRIHWQRNRNRERHGYRLAHDERLVQRLNHRSVPSLNQMKFLSNFLSPLENLIVRLTGGIIILCVIALSLNYYLTKSELVPASGGDYTEGLVGAPVHINPMFSTSSDVDADLTSLIFSGLMKYNEQGLSPDLASNFTTSEDQRVYTFELRNNLLWHDGEKLTADDIMFTFNRIQNLKTKSPLYFQFKGVNVEKISEQTIRFTLPQQFPSFLESLTVGIIPQHLWENIAPENMAMAEYNLKPLGSGPYKFDSLIKNKNGSIKSFRLASNTNYYDRQAYIDNFNFKFFDSFDNAVAALNNKNIEGLSFLPKEVRGRIINNLNLNFHLLQLPQYTAVFFNYGKHPILKDQTIRQVLATAVNKDKLINEIQNAEADNINGPILPGSIGFSEDITKYPYNVEESKKQLEQNGWILTNYTVASDSADVGAEPYPFQVRQKSGRYLEFDLTTVSQPEMEELAKELQKEWREIGVKINLKIVGVDEISEIIKQRDYQALLYGQILGYDPDPYPFWHSSQLTYPGFNLTGFNNANADKLLDDARKMTDQAARAAKYTEFSKILTADAPAIFLFNSTYTYPQNKKIKGFHSSKIIIPANRFSGVSDWYIKTDRKLLR